MLKIKCEAHNKVCTFCIDCIDDEITQTKLDLLGKVWDANLIHPENNDAFNRLCKKEYQRGADSE